LTPMGNSLGKLFTITTFGESHGSCVGVVVDGCPAGLPLAEEDIQREADRRKPKAEAASTARAEDDRVEIISGVYQGNTTGAPICLLIRNKDMDSSAYDKTRFLPRPGHADYTAFVKYGGFNDYRGGGRFSGRLTAAAVMAGAVAKELLKTIGVEVLAHTMELGGIKATPQNIDAIKKAVGKDPLRCADPTAAAEMADVIEKMKQAGDSVGGVVEGIALAVPAGLGEPTFDNLEGAMAKALFTIPAVKGVEFGSGFSAARKKGSENNDPFAIENGRIVTATNNAGGVLGGISSGMPLVVRVAIKPTASIAKPQQTIDLKTSESTTLEVSGRHDVCIVPRAVVVVESMMAITLCDLALIAGILPRVIK